ncbi:MAG: 30S ribosomal protein S3 [bacterium]
MGQKVHPIGFRLGYIKDWNSRWFAKKDYAELFHEDLQLRKFIKEKLYHAGIGRVEIERAAKQVRVNVYTARPGIIIGKKGSEIDKLKADIQNKIKKNVYLNIREIRKAEMDAQLIAENVALQLERRVAFRRAMKKSVASALRFGAKGIKIHCSGRLAGAEIARREWYREGRVPLHTLRADIDYGFAEALTTYGLIGVKVWVFKGEILEPEKKLRTEGVPL